jgi:hypothetical protein
MTITVTWFALSAASVLLILGLVDLAITWNTTNAAKDAVGKAAAIATVSNENADTLQAQSAVDFKGAWEALASLAAALKDLDRSSRLFMMSLAFFAVAAAAAGLGEIADAVAA